MILKMWRQRRYRKKFDKALKKETRIAIKEAKETGQRWLVVMNEDLMPVAVSKKRLKALSRHTGRTIQQIENSALFRTTNNYR